MTRTTNRGAKVRKNGTLQCKCGSTSAAHQVFADEYGEYTWVDLTCRKCFKTLLYTGA